MLYLSESVELESFTISLPFYIVRCSLTKWVPPPVKMTSSYVRDSINVSRKRMDVASLDMLQFHWYEFFFSMQDVVANLLSSGFSICC